MFGKWRPVRNNKKENMKVEGNERVENKGAVS